MSNIPQTVKDLQEKNTYLFCSKHFYTPSKVSRPTSGCADCWRALYLTIWARQQSDDDRREFVEGLESAIHHFAEQLEAGTWDLELHKPQITIEHVPDAEYVPDDGPKILIEE